MKATTLLRLEGAAFFALATIAYTQADGSWLLFAILLLAPDLSMLGYLRNPKIGAVFYNAAHTYALPILIGAASWWYANDLGLRISLIWIAHIGMDRTLGYGLKLPTSFQDTHLGTIGRA